MFQEYYFFACYVNEEQRPVALSHNIAMLFAKIYEICKKLLQYLYKSEVGTNNTLSKAQRNKVQRYF